MRTRLPAVLAVTVGLALGFAVSVTPSAEASRNSSGTYSLPSGNPVVSGTTISSTWANNTLGDISTELTDSLSRSGKGAMLAPLKLSAGTAAAPGLTWSLDPDSGLYRVSAGTVGLSTDATQVQRWDTTGTTLSVPVSCSPGACSFPTGVSSSAASTFSAGLTATTTGANAITTTGNGGGSGVVATGGSTSGPAIVATGGAPNGYGIRAFGTGTGWGVEGIGGTSSSAAQGTGGIFSPGTAATATTRTNSVVAYQGDLLFSAVTNPNSNVGLSNTLTPKNVVKAWARLVTTGGGSTAVTVADGFNVTGATASGTSLTVTFASAFTGTDYGIFVTPSTSVLACSGTYNTTSSALVSCRDISGAALPFPFFDFQAGASRTVYVMAIGAQ